MSPILYALYTRDIDEALSENMVALQFADDIVTYTSGEQSDEEKRKQVARSVLEIEDKLCNIGLSLQREKTEIIKFVLKSEMDTETIKLGEVESHLKRRVKFLGVWMDEELNFGEQIEAVRIKVKKAINLIRCMMGIKWGSECNTALMLYKSLVRAIIDYGLFIYYPRGNKARMKLEDTIRWNKSSPEIPE